LRGYLKLGNLVVRLSVPFIDLPKKAPAFVERPHHPPRQDERVVAAATSATGTPAHDGTSTTPDVARTQELRRPPSGDAHDLSMD
jgi:hypothetical protein